MKNLYSLLYLALILIHYSPLFAANDWIDRDSDSSNSAKGPGTVPHVQALSSEPSEQITTDSSENVSVQFVEKSSPAKIDGEDSSCADKIIVRGAINISISICKTMLQSDCDALTMHVLQNYFAAFGAKHINIRKMSHNEGRRNQGIFTVNCFVENEQVDYVCKILPENQENSDDLHQRIEKTYENLKAVSGRHKCSAGHFQLMIPGNEIPIHFRKKTCFIQQFLPGETFSVFLKKWVHAYVDAESPEERNHAQKVLELGAENVGRTIAHMHTCGVLHGDCNSGNFLLDYESLTPLSYINIGIIDLGTTLYLPDLHQKDQNQFYSEGASQDLPCALFYLECILKPYKDKTLFEEARKHVRWSFYMNYGQRLAFENPFYTFQVFNTLIDKFYSTKNGAKFYVPRHICVHLIQEFGQDFANPRRSVSPPLMAPVKRQHRTEKPPEPCSP